MARYQITNRGGPIDFECRNDLVRRTLQNAQNLLACNMGEVPYCRLMGFDRSLYDLPLPEFEDKIMPELDRLMLYEPDAEAVSAEVTVEQDGSYTITATVEIDIGEG